MALTFFRVKLHIWTKTEQPTSVRKCVSARVAAGVNVAGRKRSVVVKGLTPQKKVKKSQKNQNVYGLCGTLESQYFSLKFYMLTFMTLLRLFRAITANNSKVHFFTPP